MVGDLREYLEDYDDATEDLLNTNGSYFEHNLRKWLHSLESKMEIAELFARHENRTDFDRWYAQAEEKAATSGMGTTLIDWPLDRMERIGLQLRIFRKFCTGEVVPLDFIHTFVSDSSDFDVMYANFSSYIFKPFAREVRRIIVRYAADHESAIPASDRVVSLNDNQEDFETLNSSLQELEDAIRGNNEYADKGDQGQRVAEISAFRRVVEFGKARMDVIVHLGYKTIKYLTKTFAEQSIGIIAAGVLALISKILGLW